MNKAIVVIGGGAGGMMAAICAARKGAHVTLLVRDRALGISVEDGHVAAVKGEKGDYTASTVILATGGLSYPATGSTGDGFRMAEALGHTVTPLRGSLVPLEARECAVLQGLSLRNVALTVYENNKKIHSDFGEMLFTHFGVSGPLILSASARMRHFDKKQYRLEIDLKPRSTSKCSTSACCRILKSTQTATTATCSARFCRRR